MVEDLAHRGLLEHLAGERDGRSNVCMHYVPWYLVLSASIDGLQLIARFSEVRGMLVDVFRAVVYLGPLGRHYHQLDAFSRVNWRNCPRECKQTIKIAKYDAFSKICSELLVVF
jgi:hypothetical protein